MEGRIMERFDIEVHDSDGESVRHEIYAESLVEAMRAVGEPAARRFVVDVDGEQHVVYASTAETAVLAVADLLVAREGS